MRLERLHVRPLELHNQQHLSQTCRDLNELLQLRLTELSDASR